MPLKKIMSGDLRTVSAVPQCLDGAWVPPEYYTQEDIDWPKSIRREFNGALLSSEQLIINRAFTYNNRLLGEIYQSAAEADAFRKALSLQDIVIFFYNEKSLEDQPRFPTRRLNEEENQFKAFQRICRDADVPCLRFDWQDDDSNQRIIQKQLAERFHTYFSGILDNTMDFRVLGRELEIHDDQLAGFFGRLRELQDFVRQIAGQRTLYDPPRFVTRAEICSLFINEDTAAGTIDPRLPFAREIKALVDLKYNCGLPDALQKFAINAEGDLDRTILQEIGETQRSDRFDEADEEALISLISRNAFDEMTSFATYDFLHELDLEDVMAIRGSGVWSDYMSLVRQMVPSSHVEINLANHVIMDEAFRKSLERAHAEMLLRAAKVVQNRLHIEEVTGWCEITASVVGQGLKFIAHFGQDVELEIPEELAKMTSAAVAPIVIELTMGYTKAGQRHAIRKYPLLKKKLDGPSTSFRRTVEHLRLRLGDDKLRKLTDEKSRRDDRKGSLNLPDEDA